ncbi:protein C3orf33 homolog [Leucoraja erinacea]|uniref:protein C3orf33 homolog n=1 Tax=Leucoraja erinaceus TaxID=7782 RepID=UPI0024574670|nr:protein C3orf33 homolog [Leucoraja erinacea]
MSDRGSNSLGSSLGSAVQFVDGHLQAVRTITTGLVVIGIVMLGRSIRLMTKFTSVLEIPNNFIDKSIKLRGRIHQVTENGLEIEHIPIYLPFISSLQRKWQSDGLLMIRLAGLQMTDEGRTWLTEQVKSPHVIWFQLLRRDNSFVDCMVKLNKGSIFSVSLNEEILKKGLGRAVKIEGLHSNPKLYWRLQTKLLKAELKAQKTGKGIWKEPTILEKVSNNVQNSNIFHHLNNLLSWVKSFRNK